MGQWSGRDLAYREPAAMVNPPLFLTTHAIHGSFRFGSVRFGKGFDRDFSKTELVA